MVDAKYLKKLEEEKDLLSKEVLKYNIDHQEKLDTYRTANLERNSLPGGTDIRRKASEEVEKLYRIQSTAREKAHDKEEELFNLSEKIRKIKKEEYEKSQKK